MKIVICQFYHKFFLSCCIAFLTTSAAVISQATEVVSSPNNLSQSVHIRSLAASCAACHGSNGNSADILPSLAGLDASYFVTQMLGFKDGSRAATVMHHHAKGLNIDEINLLAVYFAQQKRLPSIQPSPQTLKAQHD